MSSLKSSVASNLALCILGKGEGCGDGVGGGGALQIPCGLSHQPEVQKRCALAKDYEKRAEDASGTRGTFLTEAHSRFLKDILQYILQDILQYIIRI